MRVERFEGGVRLHFKDYQIDFDKYFVARLLATATLALAAGYGARAAGLNSCGGSESDDKSICSLYGYFDINTCPTDYPTFYNICLESFKNGTDVLFNAISQSVSYQDGWPMLNDEGIFRTICNAFPSYNQTAFPYCGPLLTTTCVQSTWTGFSYMAQVTCKAAASKAATVAGSLTGVIGFCGSLWKTVKKNPDGYASLNEPSSSSSSTAAL